MPKFYSMLRVVGILSVVALALVLVATAPTWSQPGAGQTEAAAEAEPAPPADQHYVGVKQCASCHFDQFMKWRATKHAATFDLLPAEYQANATCLQCHTTGFGTATGFKTAAESPDLKGTSCEACHGPGSKHAEIAQQFANQRLTAEQEKTVRDSIWMMLPKNVCVECHRVQGHHESATPEALRKSG